MCVCVFIRMGGHNVDVGVQASELVSRQLRHMQELRDFEKGIVSRAEEILMSGQDAGGGGKRLGPGGIRQSRKYLLGGGGSGSSVGPVARPVMRVQGSRNILQQEADGDDGSDEDGDRGSSDAATPGPGRRPLPGRGFGRSAPGRRAPSRLPPPPASGEVEGEEEEEGDGAEHADCVTLDAQSGVGNTSSDNALMVCTCLYMATLYIHIYM